MGYRTSATQQVANNDPNKKHKARGRGTNAYFEAGAASQVQSQGAVITLAIPVGQKPPKNKATK